MVDIGDSSANSQSDFSDSYFSSSMEVEALNGPNNNSQMHAHLDSNIKIIFDSFKYDGTSNRIIFREDSQ